MKARLANVLIALKLKSRNFIGNVGNWVTLLMAFSVKLYFQIMVLINQCHSMIRICTYITVSKSKLESFKAFQSESSKSFVSLALVQSNVLLARSHLHFVQINKVLWKIQK